ncbi:MAG: glycosyltransferase family 39 protein [Candidatus Omnitrophica bacterium]|nr:glycosyltransferase family 39 protein [Candidatus Omnitrophota bacterium]
MSRHDPVIIALLILSGVLLLAHLDNGYLWQDEAETALLARHTLQFGYPRGYDGRQNYIEIEPFGYGPREAWIYNPWLPFYLLAGVFALAGESTGAARLPFALCGLLTIFLTWRLAAWLTDDRRIQRFAVALLTFSVPFLLHMRQCRYYAMATLLLIAVCLAYLAFLARPTLKRAMGLAALLTLLFHTNFGTFIPCALALFLHQAGWGSRETSRPFLIGMGLVIALTFPWILYFYRPAFIGAVSLERLYRHLEYYVRVTNKFLVPIGFMAAMSGVFALTRRAPPPSNGTRRPSALPWFIVLMVGVQVAFLLIPDQRHLRYLMPLFPLLVIGEAWWFVRWWLGGPWPRLGWVMVALALFTNVLRSPHAAVPLVDFVYELTHRYVGPMEGVVGYLRSHGRPDQVVKIPYDDRTIMFYTNLKVERPSEFLRETFPDWVVIRRGWISPHFFEGSYLRRIQATYERIELDAPDAYWQNREDPDLHHFRRAWWPPPVVIYRKRGAPHGKT